MVLLILFCFDYFISRVQKKLAKITAKSKKKKTRQSSKTDVSDFKIECTKMLLMRFYQHG